MISVFFHVLMANAKVEIGRSISSAQYHLSISKLQKIQSTYNKLGLLSARLVGSEFQIDGIDQRVKINILNLRKRQFQINHHFYQLSDAVDIEFDKMKIVQILNKDQVLGISEVEGSHQQMVSAIYYFMTTALVTLH